MARLLLRARALRVATCVALSCFVTSPVWADDEPRGGSSEASGVYVTGSFLLRESWGTARDPAGPGYLAPHFHGLPDGLVLGGSIGGGIVISRGWSVGGEFVAGRANGATITEETRARFEGWIVSSRYAEHERLLSLLLRRHLRVRGIEVEPLGGVTLSLLEQRLRDRRGTYTWWDGQLPITRPDVDQHTTRVGFTGGADLVSGLTRHTALVWGLRVHWIPRSDPRPSGRTVPVADPVVLHVGAGLRWTRPAR
jgi:hypothetical protein